ncbi:hypothetical protein KAR91_22960 [Candidatus Pacearchaeota archaeon]|nr:hypothetical protein [Candidatus Pacearchaeota archaeon]
MSKSFDELMRISDEEFERWVVEEHRKSKEAFYIMLERVLQPKKEETLSEMLEKIKNAPCVLLPSPLLASEHDIRDARKLFKQERLGNDSTS